MELITVGNYPDLATAEVAASLLEAEGIGTLIPDENFAGLSWQMGSAIQGIRVQVASEDAEAALSILREHAIESGDIPGGEPQGDAEPASEDPRCPACGSDSLGDAKWRNRLKATAIFFPPVLLLWPVFAATRPRFQCLACGHGWR
ncbi:MAG: DUF2007 domain-containing protein [Thermoanaerobaculia bacterium]|nr:DUF2007 domain-containing protein [Thermoanaerobaculia bacterium]